MPRAGRLERDTFDAYVNPHGALFAGSPAEIIDKILRELELMGHTRFLAQQGLGGAPRAATLRSIEMLVTEVLPAVRAAIGSDPSLDVEADDEGRRECAGLR